MVSPLVFKTRNMIIGFEAVSRRRSISASLISPRSFLILIFSFLISSMPSMAFRPRGVAALSRPSMLAPRFMKMWPKTGCPSGMSGKSRRKSGLRARARALTSPPYSPIFMMPIHRASVPVRPREISNAVFDDSNVDSMMAGNTSKFPMHNCTVAMRKATRMNPIQM